MLNNVRPLELISPLVHRFRVEMNYFDYCQVSVKIITTVDKKAVLRAQHADAVHVRLMQRLYLSQSLLSAYPLHSLSFYDHAFQWGIFLVSVRKFISLLLLEGFSKCLSKLSNYNHRRMS